MMILRFSCYLLVLFFIVHAAGNNTSALTASINLPAHVTIPAVIVFGDSIMDTGNNNNLFTLLKCNFPPYGKVFPGAIPTGRFSDGRVPSDFVAEMLGITRTLPAYLSPNLEPKDLLKGVTFASGGSGFDPLTAKLVSVISVWDQLNYFMEYKEKLKQIVGDERANFIIENSLFLVVSSSNDIAHTSLAQALRYDPAAYTTYLADLASNFTRKLYDFGARRIGVFSAVPVGCVPAQRTIWGGRSQNCAQHLNDMAIQFNSKLSPMLDSLQKELPKSRIVYINVYDVLFDMIQNPKNYGFEVANRACCGLGNFEVAILCNRFNPWTCSNSSAHVFWDSYHPSERTYKIIVENLLPKYITKIF